MEDHLQTIIGMIVAVFLLFIFPVYMAYEKKDDVSYALALRYTEDFVESVENTGYLTKEMYDNFKSKLIVTNNSYDIQIVHKYYKSEPVVRYYNKDNKEIVQTLTYEVYDSLTKAEKESLNEEYIIDKTYETYSELIYTDHILNIINSEQTNEDLAIYTMNAGDEITVSIVNTNLTPATLIFNMLSINSTTYNQRIYVNAKGTIKNTGKIDKAYSSYLNNRTGYNICSLANPDLSKDNIISTSINIKCADIPAEKGNRNSIAKYVVDYKNSGVANRYFFNTFTIEFEVIPSKITRLNNVLATQTVNEKIDEYSILFGAEEVYSKGNYISANNQKLYPMKVSVGTNGICILYKDKISENKFNYTTLLSYPIDIYSYTSVKIDLKDNTPYLYINGELVQIGNKINKTGEEVGNLYIIDKLIVDNSIKSIGKFYGRVKNIKIYSVG